MGRGTSLESSGTCGVPELVIELDELDFRSAKPCDIGGINARGRHGFDAYVLMMYAPHLNEEPMLEPTESSKSRSLPRLQHHSRLLGTASTYAREVEHV